MKTKFGSNCVVFIAVYSALLSSDYRDVLTSRLKAGFPSGR